MNESDNFKLLVEHYGLKTDKIITGSKCFGIGMNKTGSTTLGRCFNILGIKPIANPGSKSFKTRRIVKSIFQKKNNDLVIQLGKYFRAFEDRPWNIWDIYQLLDKAYPGSKFVLTEREPEKWWVSVERWIRTHPDKLGTYLNHLQVDRFDKEAFINSYIKHNQSVKEYFNGRDNFLIMNFEKGDGWDKLCSFIELKAPSRPFPHANSHKKNNGTLSKPHTPVTGISISASSGNKLLDKLLKNMAKDSYTRSVLNEENKRIIIRGNLQYSDENILHLKKNNIKAVFIYSDPRYILHNLLQRPNNVKNKFAVGLNQNVKDFHQLIAQNDRKRANKSYTGFYVETLDGKTVLKNIFHQLKWKDHPQIRAIKYEELINLYDDNDTQLKTITDMAAFLNVSIEKPKLLKLVNKCSEEKKTYLQKTDNHIHFGDFYTEEDKMIFKKHFGDLLIDLGYEKDNNW